VSLEPAGRDGNPKQSDAQKLADAKKKRDAYDQHMQRGKTAQNAANWDTALEAFKAAQALFPGDPASAQLIKVAEKAKTAADAVTARANAISRAIVRARNAIKAQKFNDAEAALDEAAKIDANHVDLKIARQELADARLFATKVDPATAELAPFPREAGVELVSPKNVPDPVRQPVAKLFTRDTLVLGRRRDTDNWERIEPLKILNTADTIMALPGNAAEVRFDSGVALTLWGSLPQYQSIPVLDLQESRIVPHVPPRGYDADFTLESGRVFITRPVAKGKPASPARVRVRFKEEVWEITLLDAETEVCVDLLGYYPEGVPFSKDKDGPPPKAEFYFGLLQGKAGLKVKFKEYPMLQAPMKADWDSIGGEFNVPERINRDDMVWWNKAIPDHEGAKTMQAAVAYFIDHLKKSEASLETVFNSAMKDEKELPNRRAYAIHCLQAIESISFLADTLDTADARPVARTRSPVLSPARRQEGVCRVKCPDGDAIAPSVSRRRVAQAGNRRGLIRGHAPRASRDSRTGLLPHAGRRSGDREGDSIYRYVVPGANTRPPYRQMESIVQEARYRREEVTAHCPKPRGQPFAERKVFDSTLPLPKNRRLIEK
jgi:tetratricopeptide (TPR) repeat protein